MAVYRIKIFPGSNSCGTALFVLGVRVSLDEGLMMGLWNTDDLENPFAEEAAGDKINLAGRSLVLLKEVATAQPKKSS